MRQSLALLVLVWPAIVLAQSPGSNSTTGAPLSGAAGQQTQPTQPGASPVTKPAARKAGKQANDKTKAGTTGSTQGTTGAGQTGGTTQGAAAAGTSGASAPALSAASHPTSRAHVPVRQPREVREPQEQRHPPVLRMPRHPRRLLRRRRFRSPFTLRRGPYSLTFRGQLQVQGVLYVGKDALYENGDPASNEGVLIRRARIGVEGRLPYDFRYDLTIEADSDLQRGSDGQGLAGQFLGAELLDAYLMWARWRMLRIGAGATKVPGPKGRMVTARNLQLMERPLSVEQMIVDRRPGLWIEGDLRWFSYLLGFYNADKGLNFGNEGGGYMSAVRLEMTPLGPMGNANPDDLRAYRHLYRKVRIGVGTSFQYAHGPTTDRMTVSGDVGLKWHGLSVMGEVIYNWERPREQPTTPSPLPETTKGLGVYGQAGYFILPGRLEAAVRFEYMDPDLQIDSAWDVWALTGAINFHWTRHILAQLAYIHKQEVHNAQVDNDALLLQLQAAF
ncbi:MAG: hypothetical protein J7M25_14675 [Deltaproteobacteria bacterium]|nr:hypothetical protein [Deltaproteobacteria bacterium]